ncbi:hypothetical protein M9434_000026 [Picochlorum sp. BPE23]|nr:hypothetical protein M9434_000026 [Picochlorum sp. BPE23]
MFGLSWISQVRSTGRSFRVLGRTRHCYGKQVKAGASTRALFRRVQPPFAHSVGSQDIHHVPVLLEEVLEAFQPLELRAFVDGTLGAGGHSRAILEAHQELQWALGFDKDPLAHDLARENMRGLGVDVLPPVVLDDLGERDGGKKEPANGRYMVPIRGNFSDMKETLVQLEHEGIVPNKRVDGILLDLGVSSMQLDIDERGFSFMKDGPLDMRMDPTSSVTAEVIVNTWSEAKLGKILKEFGEERYWKSIARRIADRRVERPIMTTKDLVDAIGNPGGVYSKKRGDQRKNRKQNSPKHPATRVFQALRIAVNGELDAISHAVPDAIEMLHPGGRLAIITFHSLEDRIVKWAFRRAAGMAPSDSPLPGYCLPFDNMSSATGKIITRKPICPSEREEEQNVRSRSAKLRVLEKL